METTKTTSAASGGQATVSKDGTTTVSSSVDELTQLAMANADLESDVRAQSGSKLNFISLLGKQARALDEEHPNHIPDAKHLDYAIVNKKLLLGRELDATILGMFKVYAEVKKKESDSEMPKTVSFWMPEDAEQYKPTGFFDRELPNGNILQPQHWVFLYLHKYPDIEDGLISFRSVGNAFYKQLKELVQENSTACTELRFTVSNQKRKNEKYDKTDYYPLFELTGRNYSIVDGKIKKGDADIDEETLKEILLRSKKLYESYSQMRLVGKQNIQPPNPDRKAIPTYVDEDEDQTVSF